MNKTEKIQQRFDAISGIPENGYFYKRSGGLHAGSVRAQNEGCYQHTEALTQIVAEFETLRGVRLQRVYSSIKSKYWNCFNRMKYTVTSVL
jgi:hypothetical protein